MGERRQDESIQMPNSWTQISSRLYHCPVVKITNSWHPECKEQNMCYLWNFLLFTFLPSPHLYIFPRGNVAFSWKVTFAGRQADGGSHRQAQFSSLTMCHSKALKISVLEAPGLLLNLGHWQHKPCWRHPRVTQTHQGPFLIPGTQRRPSLHCVITTIWASGFFLLLFLIQPL